MDKRKSYDFISDGKLAYGVEIGRFILDNKIVYALSDLMHVSGSDVSMFYQLRKNDYDKLYLLASKGYVPDPPVSREITDKYHNIFLCGESAHAKRNGFTLKDVAINFTEDYLNSVTIKQNDNEIVIKGNKSDLLELSGYIKRVAESDSEKDHIHIDDLTIVSEESDIKNLVIEKEE